MQQVEVFRKYALDLVLAAIPPLLDNDTIVEGGCECRLATDEHLNPVDLALETMAIAKNLDAYVEAMKHTSSISAFDVGMLKNMRRILVVLETWPDDIHSAFVARVFKTYLSKYKRKPTEAKLRDENVDLAMKCYQTLYSFQCGKNREYFDDLFHGFGIASELMREGVENVNGDSRWNDLKAIEDRMSTHQLRTPKDKYTKRAIGLLFVWLDKDDAKSDAVFNKLLECDLEWRRRHA